MPLPRGLRGLPPLVLAAVGCAAVATAYIVWISPDSPSVLRFFPRESAEPAPHKVLWPLNWRDFAGFGLASLALILAASGGIGGGGLLVPLYLVVMGFNASSAVALSNITIVGGTLANFAFNIRRRHPLRDAPLIHWDLILVMEPSTIIGALFGGYVNHVLPEWLTTVALAVLLGLLTFRLVQRALIMRRGAKPDAAETVYGLNGSNGAAAPISPPEVDPAAARSSAGGAGVEASPVSVLAAMDVPPRGAAAAAAAAPPAEADGLEEPLLQAELIQPAAPPDPGALRRAGQLAQPARLRAEVPPFKLAALLLLVAGVVASNLAKQRFECPSWAYWAAATAIVPAILVLLAFVRRYLLRKAAARAAPAPVAGAVAPPADDVAWTPTTTVLYPALCTLAGVCAGMFGVGGGIIKGPLMLEMGVNPLVAAATSTTMILFTSLSASVVFLSFGALPLGYGAVLCVLGIIMTVAGQLLTHWVARRTQSQTLTVELMAALMGLSTVVLAAQGAFVTRSAMRGQAVWHWGTVCSELGPGPV